MEQPAALQAREVDEVNLCVGALRLRPRADERRRVPGGNRERAGSSQQILNTNTCLTPKAGHVVVERDVLAATPERTHIKMVLERFAHLPDVEHHRDAVLL